MELVEAIYVLSSTILALAGLTMVGLATRAYVQTTRRAMIHLSLGFAFVVAAAVATTVSAFVTDFQNVRSLLVVNSGMSTIGYTFVVYSLVTYD